MKQWSGARDQVICGDMRAVTPRLPDGTVDLIITDPPFNIKERSKISKKYGGGKQFGKKLGSANLGPHPEEYMSECYRVLKEGRVICCFYAWSNLEELLIPFKHLFHFMQIGVWHKTNPPPAMRGVGFQNACELFVLGKKKGQPHYFNKILGQSHNVFSLPFPSSSRRKHPTQKPVALFCKIIERFSRPGEVIFDPFMGTGTAGIAAKILGRNFVGCEIDPEVYRDACEAINAATL